MGRSAGKHRGSAPTGLGGVVTGPAFVPFGQIRPNGIRALLQPCELPFLRPHRMPCLELRASPVSSAAISRHALGPRNNLILGYQGEPWPSAPHRQSTLGPGRASHTGRPSEPVRCASDVSTVMTRSMPARLRGRVQLRSGLPGHSTTSRPAQVGHHRCYFAHALIPAIILSAAASCRA